MQNQHVEKRVRAMIAQLISMREYDTCVTFGVILSGLKLDVGQGGPAGTLAVDGKTLFVNTQYFLSKSDPELYFILLHEAFHCASRHPWRLRDAMPQHKELVHKAADYAVNLALVQDSQPFQMVEGGLINQDYCTPDGRALNYERILPLLAQQAAEQPREQEQAEEEQDHADNSDDNAESAESDTHGDTDSDSYDDDASTEPETGSGGTESADGCDDNESSCQGSGSNDELESDSEDTVHADGELLPAPDDATEEQAVDDLLKAAAVAKAAGCETSPLVSELVHSATNRSKTDWLTALREKFRTAVDKSDYSFKRFNNRYAQFGLIAPKLHTNGIGRVAIIGDESGSMSDDQIQQIAEQTNALIQEWNPAEILVIRHDSEIVFTERLMRGETPTLRTKRTFGGTSFQPVIDLCEREQVDVAVWVTDCFPCDKPKEPVFPTVFVNVDACGEYGYNRLLGWGDFVDAFGQV